MTKQDKELEEIRPTTKRRKDCMSKTSPSLPKEPNGNCPECGGNGKIGMYWERCNTCDGTGSSPTNQSNKEKSL